LLLIFGGFHAKAQNQKPLTTDRDIVIIKGDNKSQEEGQICRDACGECKAANPLKYGIHGKKARSVLEKKAIGKNEFSSGFSQSNGNAHWRKHMAHYPGMTSQEYAEAALELIQSHCGGSIRGYVRENGQIVRYNAQTKDYVIGNNDEKLEIPVGIASMHRINEVKYERKMKEEAYGDDYY
jgi:hypothetical protein